MFQTVTKNGPEMLYIGPVLILNIGLSHRYERLSIVCMKTLKNTCYLPIYPKKHEN